MGDDGLDAIERAAAAWLRRFQDLALDAGRTYERETGCIDAAPEL